MESMVRPSAALAPRGAPAHYEQTVREEDAASVYGYSGLL